jgi:hypothetical protein
MQPGAAFILRLYGVACAGWGLIALWRALAVTSDPGGVAHWIRLWPEFALCALLGVSVILLLRWFVLAFSILSAGIGIFYVGLTLMTDPFPAELFHLLFAILLIIPAFLTSRAWRSLR